MLERKGVMLLPGGNYDMDGRYFRLGFGRRNMPECLARFEEYIDGGFSEWTR